jgi:hypothetical protein
MVRNMLAANNILAMLMRRSSFGKLFRILPLVFSEKVKYPPRPRRRHAKSDMLFKVEYKLRTTVS